MTQHRPWLGAHRDSYLCFDPFGGTGWIVLNLLYVQELEGGLVEADPAAYVKVLDVGVNAVDVEQK